MIVRNEERALGNCLASIQPWVDEMMVVDTGSEDGTVGIAESFGAKVHHFTWCDDFSAARNESLTHATGEWIFWMDADDTIPEECGRRMRDLVLLAEDRVSGFLMQVHFPAAPGETGLTVVDHVKLFRNIPEYRFEGRIHEQILESIYRHGGEVRRTDLYVAHSGYDHSPKGQRRKRERDLRILELDLHDRPDHPFVLFNIGMTAFHMREFDKARHTLERCLALCKPEESIVRKVYALLAGCHLECGELVAARSCVEDGLRRFPRDPELLFRAGGIYRECGDLTSAEHAHVKLLTARETGHIDSLDVSIATFRAHHNLAVVYRDMGRIQDAEANWRAAAATNPGFVASWLGLGELYLATRRFDDAQTVLARLAEIAPPEAERFQARLARNPVAWSPRGLHPRPQQ